MRKIFFAALLISSCDSKPPPPVATPPPAPIPVTEARPPAELEVENAGLKRDLQDVRTQLSEERQTLANLRVMYADLQKAQHPVGVAIGKWFQTHDADHRAMCEWMKKMEAALERRAHEESAREAKKALDNLNKIIKVLGD